MKQITNFRKDHEIKVKVKEGQKYYGVSIPSEDFTYGVPNRYAPSEIDLLHLSKT
jgi:hypothetical protein